MRRSAEASSDSGEKAVSTWPEARRAMRCHCGTTLAAITPTAHRNAPPNSTTPSIETTVAIIEPTPSQVASNLWITR